MTRRLAFFCLVLLQSVIARGVDFDTQVMPVLTRYGCNSGACHGAAAGRGGLRLSLYGSNPTFDYEALAIELEGRRVNRVHPSESLIFLKPTESLNHGGGMRFESDSEPARLLLEWLRTGARRSSSPRRLTSFSVEPPTSVVERTGDAIRFKAVARFADGTEQEVTRWTVFNAEDDAAVDLSLDGSGRLLRTGRHIITARFLDRVIAVEVVIPVNEHRVTLIGSPDAGFIDKLINRKLETLRLPPSPLADDTSFLRRARIALTGRLPTPAQVESFLKDDNPEKRSRLIDGLLDSSDFEDFWTFRLSQWLRIRTTPTDDTAARTYFRWVRSQLKERVPFDEMARALLLARGDTHTQGPPSFYLAAGNAREQAEFASELFMGARLRCANCHDHPLDRWTQDDYHGLAAIFARVKRGRVIAVDSRGEAIHPRTQAPAVPRIPADQFLAADADGRAEFARWLTSPNNAYFTRAIVNRLWKAIMGRGLVEPVDDHRATNPATHPELLDWLAKDFIEHQYDLRHTLRLICTSHAWQRSTRPVTGNENDDRFYSRGLRYSLEPEVLADAITDVTGLPEKYGDEPVGTRAIELVGGNVPARSLDILGRCGRDGSCESNAGATGGLPRALHLVNGDFLNRRLSDSNGRLHRMLLRSDSTEDVVTEFYLRSLSRHPEPNELDFWKRQFAVATTPEDQAKLAEDFVWSLLTCEEFMQNH